MRIIKFDSQQKYNMKLKVIITGATGMVGEGVLQESISNPNVEKSF